MANQCILSRSRKIDQKTVFHSFFPEKLTTAAKTPFCVAKLTLRGPLNFCAVVGKNNERRKNTYEQVLVNCKNWFLGQQNVSSSPTNKNIPMTVFLRHWTKKTKNSHNCKIWLRHEKRKILKILRGLVTREDQQQKRQNNKII